MKKIILLFSLCFISISCSNDDDSESSNKLRLTKINIPTVLKSFFYDNEYLETFEYDEADRITQRNGGYIKLPLGLGIPYIFTNNLYEKIDYTGNTINVITYEVTDNKIVKVIPALKFYIKNNTIDYREVIFDDERNINKTSNKKEIFLYENNRLSEIVTTYPNQTDSEYIFTAAEKFYYDIHGNLTKTEYQEFVNGDINSPLTIKTFENYDNSPNPFKNLIYIEDYFYRSLSKNNFRKYTKKVYDRDSKTLISEEQMNWDPTYDAKGNIILYIEK